MEQAVELVVEAQAQPGGRAAEVLSDLLREFPLAAAATSDAAFLVLDRLLKAEQFDHHNVRVGLEDEARAAEVLGALNDIAAALFELLQELTAAMILAEQLEVGGIRAGLVGVIELAGFSVGAAPAFLVRHDERRVDGDHPLTALGIDPLHNLVDRVADANPRQRQSVTLPQQFGAARAVALAPGQINPDQPPRRHCRSRQMS